MSDSDIGAGARWRGELSQELSAAQFGILCITRENANAPWLLFEAGAMSNVVHVCPYCIDLRPVDLPAGPLTLFQSKFADKDGTLSLVIAINECLGRQAIPPDRLKDRFEQLWPQLESRLQPLAAARPDSAPARSVENMLEETVQLLRDLTRSLAQPAGSPDTAGGGPIMVQPSTTRRGIGEAAMGWMKQAEPGTGGTHTRAGSWDVAMSWKNPRGRKAPKATKRSAPRR